MEILDSASALSRLKRERGYTVSAPNVATGYIAFCKIRRILNNEFTDDMFKVRERRITRTSRVTTRQERIRIYMDRLDKYPANIVKAMYVCYQLEGIDGLLQEFSPHGLLLRKTMAEA